VGVPVAAREAIVVAAPDLHETHAVVVRYQHHEIFLRIHPFGFDELPELQNFRIADM
jgi:hypothetical protein